MNAEVLGDDLEHAIDAEHMALSSGGRVVGPTPAAKMANKALAMHDLCKALVRAVYPAVPELTVRSADELYEDIRARMASTTTYQPISDFVNGRPQGASAASIKAEVKRMGANKAKRAKPLIHFYCSGCAAFHTSSRSPNPQSGNWLFQHECLAYPKAKLQAVGSNMNGIHKPTGFLFTQVGQIHRNDIICEDCRKCRNPRLPFC